MIDNWRYGESYADMTGTPLDISYRKSWPEEDLPPYLPHKTGCIGQFRMSKPVNVTCSLLEKFEYQKRY